MAEIKADLAKAETQLSGFQHIGSSVKREIEDQKYKIEKLEIYKTDLEKVNKYIMFH